MVNETEKKAEEDILKIFAGETGANILLLLLFKENTVNHTIDIITEKTGEPQEKIAEIINLFTRSGILIKRHRGLSRVLNINKDNPYVQAFQELIKEDCGDKNVE